MIGFYLGLACGAGGVLAIFYLARVATKTERRWLSDFGGAPRF